MADCEVYTEHKSWRVIALDSPTNGTEMGKALIVAEQEYQAEYGHPSEWDNTFEVVAEDGKILIRFELKAGS
jgi:hypothetical protein